MVFLSHNTVDKPAVEELGRRLEAEGISCWLDKWNLAPGDLWDQAIENALGSCDVCVVFIGPSGLGPWHNEEMRQAIRRRVTDQQRKLRIVPVVLPGARRLAESLLPGFLQGTTWQEFTASIDDEEAFRRLKCGILGQPPGYSPNSAPLRDRPPYIGLKTFRKSDAPIFFGRVALLQRLLARQREHFGTPAEHRFLALIGASGSGKSSLALAGLLPAILERGELPDSDQWLSVNCRPGPNPWESLQVAIASHDKLAPHLQAVETLTQSPEREAHALHLIARIALHEAPENCRLLVFVDQFEEFFTLYRQENDRDGKLGGTRKRFLGNLLYPATVADSRVLVILTMRADFYGACADYAGLRAAVSENQVLIGPLMPEELRDAIERPAQLCGCEVEPALSDHLVDDMERQPGALPFLQHTLFKIWEKRDGRRLTLAAYRNMGSLEGALDAHAEAFYAGLSSDRQTLLRGLLLDLIQIGEGTSDTKRRKYLSQLADGNVEKLHPFIAELANANLVVTDQAGGQVQVEVSHETLITGWKRFHSWIDESRDEKRQKDRIELAAKEWADAHSSKRNDFLWRGAQLESADYLLANSTLPLNDEASRFLRACRELRDSEVAADQLEQERAREQERRIQEAELARARAEARAEIERAQEVERQRQEALKAAADLTHRAEELWAELEKVGTLHNDDWRLMRLADIESLLADALGFNRDAEDASKLLAGIRQLLVETGIKTQDLNLASIYLQKLKTSSAAESISAPELSAQLELAWSEADPLRNVYVRRLRQWALRGCWVPILWVVGMLFLAWTQDSYFLAGWVGVTGAVALSLHLTAALFAVVAASGEQRGVTWANAGALCLFPIGLFALNPVSIGIAMALSRNVRRIHMQKLLWPIRNKNAKSAT